jgi:hypothetical protein
MNVRILAISSLISVSCFAAYDETGFIFSFQEVADKINIGCVHVTMKNPPVHLQEFNKDYVQDLCLTISKNKNGTYKFSYNVKTQRQTLNLKLSEVNIDKEKLLGTIFATTPLPLNFYASKMVLNIDELYKHHQEKKEFNMQGEKIVNIPAYSAYDKMLAYIDIINRFSMPKNKLFFDKDVANQQLLKDLEHNMDAYQKSLSPEELAAFLEDVARLEEEAKIQPVEQKPAGSRSWFSRIRDAWHNWWNKPYKYRGRRVLPPASCPYNK